MTKNDFDNRGYICSDCAKQHSCCWPHGHVATFHNGHCEFCLEKKGVCHVTDWDWPKKDIKLEDGGREL